MLDVMLLPTPSATTSPDTNVFIQRADTARNLARQRILSQQDQDAHRYNSHHRAVAHLVWIPMPIPRRGSSEKLVCQYFGPYRLLHRIGEVNYEVVLVETLRHSRPPRSSNVVHATRMQPYYSRQLQATNFAVPHLQSSPLCLS